MNTNDTSTKAKALAAHLSIHTDDVEETTWDTFEAEGAEYLWMMIAEYLES